MEKKDTGASRTQTDQQRQKRFQKQTQQVIAGRPEKAEGVDPLSVDTMFHKIPSLYIRIKNTLIVL
jgi:hypothetical protein